jgi:hypothetical protein
LDDPAGAASFIAGVFLVGRDSLFADPAIIKEIDQVVSRMDAETFIAVLPNFRQAFTSFLPSETDRLGRMVAELYSSFGEVGISPNDIVHDELVTKEELILGMSLDKMAGEAMKKWGLANG